MLVWISRHWQGLGEEKFTRKLIEIKTLKGFATMKGSWASRGYRFKTVGK